MRQQILSFDGRLREISGTGNSIVYGSSKSNLCAELRYDTIRARLAVFLWLPYTTTGYKKQQIMARLKIWTDWVTVSDVSHMPKANDRTITVDEWLAGQIRPLNRLLPKSKYHREPYDKNEDYRNRYIEGTRRQIIMSPRIARHKSGVAMPLEAYRKHIRRPELSSRFKDFIQTALETWISKL